MRRVLIFWFAFYRGFTGVFTGVLRKSLILNEKKLLKLFPATFSEKHVYIVGPYILVSYTLYFILLYINFLEGLGGCIEKSSKIKGLQNTPLKTPVKKEPDLV